MVTISRPTVTHSYSYQDAIPFYRNSKSDVSSSYSSNRYSMAEFYSTLSVT